MMKSKLGGKPFAASLAVLLMAVAASGTAHAESLGDAIAMAYAQNPTLVRARAPQVEVAIVGNHPEERVRALARIPGVQVTGFVPDVEPWFQSAAVLVVPIRFGGGTRLKILEALRWERAIVSTAATARFAVRLRAGSHLVVPGSRHEILTERDPFRAQFWAAFDAFVPGSPAYR